MHSRRIDPQSVVRSGDIRADVWRLTLRALSVTNAAARKLVPRRHGATATILMSFMVATAALPASVRVASGGQTQSHIVVLDAGVAPRAFAREYGLSERRTFERVFSGFAADLTPADVARLLADPRVRGVAPDHVVRAAEASATLPGAAPALPTGVDRIDAEFTPVDETVGIAVIDSGIDLGRPELNVQGALSFVADAPAQDELGHGTHVAGIAAANTMASGFRGVAPRAPLWSLRVLDATGVGQESDLVAAIDWLTANGPALGIRVANVSLGEAGIDDGNCGLSGQTVIDPLHYAICQSVQAGIIYAAAAGNGATDAANLLPAAYPEVVAVSNMQDLDGRGGALAAPADDVFAPSSNFGAVVDVAAPGTAILSTVPTGGCAYCSVSGYAYLTGTSMATPHVAGVLAEYIARHSGTSTAGGPGTLAPAALAVLAAAQPQSGPCGFSGDPDVFAEPVVYAGVPDSQCGSVATPDSDGDGLPDVVETQIYGANPNARDTDGDGCDDGLEVSGDEMRGGRRDPTSPWDFFDVPAPAGPALGADGRPILTPASTRNKAVSLQDVGVVLTYVGRVGASLEYVQDNNNDGMPDGQQLDRTPSLTPAMPWRSGPPNGSVTLQDVGVALSQVGANCG